jgi:hypothetical protein
MMLSPILHAASGLWMLGKIENHVAKPLSREEIDSHIAEYERLRKARSAGAEASPLRTILIGEAEVIDPIPAEIRHMLDNEGLYIGSDPNDPSKGEAPLVSMGGKIYSMVIDRELNPERFIAGTRIDGPFRATSAAPTEKS